MRRNASLIEHDSNPKLQGFADIRELAPLVRYRHQPNDPGMARLKARDRDVHASIDIRLQLRARGDSERARCEKAHKDHGALVVMNPQTGDVLALVSEPAPPPPGGPHVRRPRSDPQELLDRARYGQYPPGSTFKLVTAMAALAQRPGA